MAHANHETNLTFNLDPHIDYRNNNYDYIESVHIVHVALTICCYIKCVSPKPRQSK